MVSCACHACFLIRTMLPSGTLWPCTSGGACYRAAAAAAFDAKWPDALAVKQ